MKSVMTELYRGCMRGRTMYVIPFCMGPIEAEYPMFGVEITDSEYVVVSMRVMARIGSKVLDALGTDRPFVPAMHSVGAPLEPGQADVPWPCSDTKYIVQFPEERMIWSYGSGYGGNALLGKKCYSLRIASVMARDEGWLAEHMLILKLTSPQQKTYYVAAAFPSACGKTNLAMLEPTIPGWKVETLGDDIAWMRFGEDGRLYALNPEYGLFGVAPGTGLGHQPQRHAHDREGQLGLHQRRPDRRRRHLVGGHDRRAAGAPHRLEGPDWTPDSDEPSSHPNSRFCTPITQCPILAPSTTTRRACRSRRSSSVAAARPRSRWSPRPGTGTTASSWARRSPRRPPPPPPAPSASSAATPSPCCRSSATTPVTTSATG